MGKTIIIANQKGGVGKTTVVINLAAGLGKLGAKVLLLDMDPQGNAASGIGSEREEVKTSYDLIINETPAEEAVMETEFPGVSIIPANQELSGAQVELVGMIARENRLKMALEPIKDRYDIILVDTPPSLGLLTPNAFTAGDSVFIPIQCEYFALEGISQLLKTIKLVKQNLNEDLYIEGVCLTMFDNRTNLSREVMENVVAHFKERTFKTIIPRNVRVSEAPSHGQPVQTYAPDSQGAMAFDKLSQEFYQRVLSS